MKAAHIAWLLMITFCNFASGSPFLDLCENTTDKEVQKTIAILQQHLLERDDSKGILCDELNKQLQKVSFLDLAGLGISSLKPFAGLKALSALYLSKNNIRDLWPLADLPRLKILDLKDNKIVDIGALASLPNLSVVHLDNNEIKNILPIKDLHHLSKVSFENNPALTEVDFKEANKIRELNDSLIWFRSGRTLNDYHSLDLNDIEETTTILNDTAARGHLEYFRALRLDENASVLFRDDVKYWDRLEIDTKKILIAVRFAKEICDQLLISLALPTNARLMDLEIEKTDIEGYIKDTYPKIQRAVEYFLMHNAPRAPFSFADKKLMDSAFENYINKLTHLVAKADFPQSIFKVFFSPRFVTRELEKFGKKLEKSKEFVIRSGF